MRKPCFYPSLSLSLASANQKNHIFWLSLSLLLSIPKPKQMELCTANAILPPRFSFSTTHAASVRNLKSFVPFPRFIIRAQREFESKYQAPTISAPVNFYAVNCVVSFAIYAQEWEDCDPGRLWVTPVPVRRWTRAECIECVTSWLGFSWWTSPPQPIGEGCWLSAENGTTSSLSSLRAVKKEPMPKRIPPWRRSCYALQGSSNRSLLFSRLQYFLYNLHMRKRIMQIIDVKLSILIGEQ